MLYDTIAFQFNLEVKWLAQFFHMTRVCLKIFNMFASMIPDRITDYQSQGIMKLDSTFAHNISWVPAASRLKKSILISDFQTSVWWPCLTWNFQNNFHQGWRERDLDEHDEVVGEEGATAQAKPKQGNHKRGGSLSFFGSNNLWVHNY